MSTPLFSRLRPAWIGLAICGLMANVSPVWGQSDEEMAETGETAPAPKPTVALTKTGPSPFVLWQMSEPNFSALGQELARLVEPPTAAPAPIATGPALRNDAHIAFRYGNLPLARELYFGHLALGGDAAARDLETVQFSNQFRRPAWHIRLGLAIGITGDTDVVDFDPIAADMNAGAMGNFGMEDDGMMEQESPEETFDDLDMMGMEEDGMGESGLGGSAKPAEIQAPEAQTLDPAVAERLDEVTGMLAAQLHEGLSSRIKAGRFGAALTDVADEDPAQGYMVGGETVSPADRPMWIPGVVFIGEGASREMTELAASEGIELLLYVVVSVKKSRTEEVQNICRAKVIDCKTGKTLVASGGMDNREVKRLLATKRGTAEGHVTEQLETFWNILDSRLVLTALPALSPEIAAKRVTQLMSDASYSKVRKLAEVRLFHQKGWLTDDQLEQAFEIIAGADGVKILYAPLSESVPLIRQLVRYSLIKEQE